MIAPGAVIDGFIKQGKVVPGSRIDLMKSGIGVAVRAGAPKPDISSSEEAEKDIARREFNRLFDGAERGIRSKLVRAHGHWRSG